MDRASDSGSEGWGFESLPVYQEKAVVLIETTAFSAKSTPSGVVINRSDKLKFEGNAFKFQRRENREE